MKRVISIAMLALMLCSAAFAQDEAAKRKSAENAAQSWLALVDHDDFGASWQEASSSFQSKVSKEDWSKALQQVRAQMGVIGKRLLNESTYQTELPGMPKGEYVVIQYKTELANGGAVMESVFDELDKDGKWRVAGYFVRPAQ